MRKAGAIVLGTILLGASGSFAVAEEESNDLLPPESIAGSFSGSVAFTTDYLFRGITQTRHDPAIQGSIQYNHDSGVYVGIWGSSIDFAGGDTTHAQIETDIYGGYLGSYDNLSYGIGGIGYVYPDTKDVTYAELTASLGYNFDVFSVTGAVFYSPDYTFDSGDAVYFSGDVGIPIWKSLALGAHVGHQTIEKNLNFGTPDYTDWGLSLSATILGFGVKVAYSDTDLSTSDCFGGSNACEATGVLTVSRSF